jgi:hypothetical protein
LRDGPQDEAGRIATVPRARGFRALIVDDAFYPMFVRVYAARAAARALGGQSLLLRQHSRLLRWRRRSVPDAGTVAI